MICSISIQWIWLGFFNVRALFISFRPWNSKLKAYVVSAQRVGIFGEREKLVTVFINTKICSFKLWFIQCCLANLVMLCFQTTEATCCALPWCHFPFFPTQLSRNKPFLSEVLLSNSSTISAQIPTNIFKTAAPSMSEFIYSPDLKQTPVWVL